MATSEDPKATMRARRRTRTAKAVRRRTRTQTPRRHAIPHRAVCQVCRTPDARPVPVRGHPHPHRRRAGRPVGKGRRAQRHAQGVVRRCVGIAEHLHVRLSDGPDPRDGLHARRGAGAEAGHRLHREQAEEPGPGGPPVFRRERCTLPAELGTRAGGRCAGRPAGREAFHRRAFRLPHRGGVHGLHRLDAGPVIVDRAGEHGQRQPNQRDPQDDWHHGAAEADDLPALQLAIRDRGPGAARVRDLAHGAGPEPCARSRGVRGRGPAGGRDRRQEDVC